MVPQLVGFAKDSPLIGYLVCISPFLESPRFSTCSSLPLGIQSPFKVTSQQRQASSYDSQDLFSIALSNYGAHGVNSMWLIKISHWIVHACTYFNQPFLIRYDLKHLHTLLSVICFQISFWQFYHAPRLLKVWLLLICAVLKSINYPPHRRSLLDFPSLPGLKTVQFRFKLPFKSFGFWDPPLVQNFQWPSLG